jgi:hypothetical protein
MSESEASHLELLFFQMKHKIRFLRRIGGRLLTTLAVVDHITCGKRNLIYYDNRQFMVDESMSVAVYVTHNGLIGDFWESNMLEELKQKGFNIILVANRGVNCSSIIPHEGMDVLRQNRGYDLSAVRDTVNLFEEIPNELLIINSSMAWGKGAILEMVENFRSGSNSKIVPGRIFSAVESLQKTRHAQSFIYHAIGNCNVEKLMTAYGQMLNWRTKRATVNFGELRLVRMIEAQDCEVIFLFPYEELVNNYKKSKSQSSEIEFMIRQDLKLNPTFHLWLPLIHQGFRGIKRNLASGKYSKKSKFLAQDFSQYLKNDLKSGESD